MYFKESDGLHFSKLKSTVITLSYESADEDWKHSVYGKRISCQIIFKREHQLEVICFYNEINTKNSKHKTIYGDWI